MVRLATGQQMADVHEEQGREAHRSSPKAQIRDGNNGADARRAEREAARGAAQGHARCGSTSCARPSSTAAGCKGVGARIVAETFHRAIEGSQFSIVRDPAWRPTLGPDNTTFRMVDLLLFAFEGKKTLLAPLG